MTHPNDNSLWTEKHLRFCIAQRLTPTAIKLYQWLVQEIGEGRQEIVDLHDFQKLVAKERGKGYDFRIVQTAIKRLEEAGILKSCRKFTNFVRKWTIRPINRLLYPLIPKPKKPESKSQITNLDPSNNISVVRADITTTTYLIDPELRSIAQSLVRDEEALAELQECLAACKEAGINLSPESAIKILSWCSIDDVKAAIAYTLPRATTSLEGYFRVTLENEYHRRKQRAAALVETTALVYQAAR